MQTLFSPLLRRYHVCPKYVLARMSNPLRQRTMASTSTCQDTEDWIDVPTQAANSLKHR